MATDYTNLPRSHRIDSPSPRRHSMGRMHGRITREDVRSADLKRWNGRSRVTTNWINLYQEPELFFPTGDVLVYLREQGQSSRGPAYRVHRRHLEAKGFRSLVKKCVDRPVLPTTSSCLAASCQGCEKHGVPSELYLPAPQCSDIDTTFDHHITTRNFFAWLYDLPLAGRALGHSLIALENRIRFYRKGEDESRAKLEVLAYAESQRYLDFRECVDHALASLSLAESLEVEDLWTDAFVHCVGMGRRGLDGSIEYSSVSLSTRRLIEQARVEMEERLGRVHSSIESFFEHDLTKNFLGFPQPARDHFDRFRSFLHSFYIEQYGFWPPEGFTDHAARQKIYATMYSDLRTLYLHLVDPNSTSSMATNDIASAGGVCTFQNIQAFDTKHNYETLPMPLPRLPREPAADARIPGVRQRQSWNPLINKRIVRETRDFLRAQALVEASNRDMSIVSCTLVRRYSEFEEQSVHNACENISIVEGRKIRWILIYAVLQTLISVMQSPKAVRNTGGLTYSLCCQPPRLMPWQQRRLQARAKQEKARSNLDKFEIVPDVEYLRSSMSSTEVNNHSRTLGSFAFTKKERRPSLPIRGKSSTESSSASIKVKTPPTSHSGSLKRILSRNRTEIDDVPPVPSKRAPQFCEILVHGYGNGLNVVNHEKPSDTAPQTQPDLRLSTSPAQSGPITVTESTTVESPTSVTTNGTDEDEVPDLSPSNSASVSRESSNASSTAPRPKTSGRGSDADSDTDLEASTATTTPRAKEQNDCTPNFGELVDLLKATAAHPHNPSMYDEVDGVEGSIHINTRTWDTILGS